MHRAMREIPAFSGERARRVPSSWTGGARPVDSGPPNFEVQRTSNLELGGTPAVQQLDADDALPALVDVDAVGGAGWPRIAPRQGNQEAAAADLPPVLDRGAAAHGPPLPEWPLESNHRP